MVYRLKGIIQSDDGGKTWWVRRIDYVTQADTEEESFSFVDPDVKDDFDIMVLERIVKKS